MTELEIEEKRVELEIEAKRVELETSLGCKVKAHWAQREDKSLVVGYLKEPDRFTKMQALDASMRSFTQGADILLRACLIHEESDKEILDEKGDDRIYLGFVMAAQQLVEFYAVQSKKN